MKKSLIALAVLAASGAAMAQSSVSIYGIADVWVGKSTFKDNIGGGATFKESTTEMGSGGWDTSRIGFRGTEDLGGGLKANFQIETKIAIDSPAPTSLGDRTAYIGLAGGFGEVQLGKNWTAYDDVWGAHNNNFDSAFTARPSAFGYTDNPNNTIKYISPSFGGFTGAVSYSLGEDKAVAGDESSNVFALNVAYNNGPISVAFAHQKEKVGEDGTKVGLDAEGLVGEFIGVTLADLDPDSKLTNNQISGSYDLGVAKLLATYNKAKLSVLGGDLKSNEYTFGVEVPVAANISVGAGYGQAKLKIDGENVAKAKSFGFAAYYSLSKRTTAYAGYSQTKVTFDGVTGSAKDTLYAVGVKHTF
ncbi:porin [Aquabacterium sp. A08]|uniref:porin n=1 Tax=Aquabacterium sp. A08 TaxID=2718532 RepID=UPI0014212829|nr:porin [Aquabacterium sp. A08]NIC42556.1 porin [Aquabacterium sp. A08]